MISTEIRRIAEAIGDPPEFSRRAHETAKAIGASAIELLAAEFHTEHSPPADVANKFPGLGQWIAARQFSIFEVLFYLGPASLPVLRRVAFGEYDWTQGNAIEVLCRFAAHGIEREQILMELKNAMPGFRYEALIYAAGPLRSHANTDPNVQAVIEELLSVPEFKEAYDELSNARA
ncbi:hypothetical protein R0381_002920 [Jeongeupia wiesaeckerbachi]|uniref:hypothetical protein n=1 Tax=Jeongeupia wiesaeckerbachi TaxID=3051218 RepID=UPI003D802389